MPSAGERIATYRENRAREARPLERASAARSVENRNTREAPGARRAELLRFVARKPETGEPSPPEQTLMSTESPSHEQREFLRRVNNFLTLCMTHAEAALDSEEPAEMSAALRWILSGAQAMEPHARVNTQSQFAFAAAERGELD